MENIDYKSLHLTPEQEDQNIEAAFQDVLDGYLHSNHRKKVEIIKRAYSFAKEAHKGIRRRSGEPYILHPIAVAKIVSQEIGLGSTSICAALLHDVVEDTEYTVEDIEMNFGKKIALIVDGLTKISGGIFGDRASAQAENFRKLLLTMAEDIRVILIKMADRLHNMRTLGSMLPSKQYKIAGETLYIYAPLAHRLGLFAIKTELEDLSFKYQHPEQYKEIVAKIKKTDKDRQMVFENFAAPIREKLDEMGLKYSLSTRVKSAFSIWNKMETKHVPFEEVYDLYAVRIVFDCCESDNEKTICWSIYSAITDIYKLHPTRTRDWVSTPKANGYRALHLTVMGNDGNWVEVQIRSQKMDDIAERGFAAHWKYKIGESDEESELETWLKTITDLLKEPGPNAVDFLDTIKLNLFATEIIVFTPKGDLVTLPKDATVLDLAYNLHSEIGSHAIAGKVNHRLVPISYKLQSGDQVEILTSKSQRVQPEWEVYATTARARAKIAAILRKEAKTYQKEGETILNEFFKNEDIRMDDAALDKLTRLHGFHTRDELLVAIGNKRVVLGDADKNVFKEKQNSNWKKFLTFSFGNKDNKDAKEQPEEKTPQEKINTKQILKLTEETISKNYIMADCCHPIPGDDVLGYIDEQNRVVIHKRQCPVATRLKSSYGNRIIATEWDTHKDLSFLVTIYIKGIDSMGLLNEVTQVISRQLNVNIRKLTIETNDGIFEGKIQLYVHDVDDVRTICNNLKQIQNIKQVTRVEE